MGKKYRRYKNALEKFLSSDKGRRFFHVAYSVGASVVVLGALFKINHYPLGNEIMLIGLGAEALIFFISAFDSPVRDYRWEEVFPEFATPEQLEQRKYYEEKKRLSSNSGNETEVAESQDIQSELARGKVTTYYPSSNAASQQAEHVIFDDKQTAASVRGDGSGLRGDTPIVAPTAPLNASVPPVKRSEILAESVASTTERASITPSSGIGFTPDMASASENYVSQVNLMSENVGKFNELTQSLNELSDVLISSFKNITDNSEGIGNSTKGYVSQMENLNRNISGLNTIYEIQLKGVSSQINAIDQINAGLERIKNLYDGSITDSTVFRTETERMAQQLKDLNAVYARMLQAMTLNMQMGSGMPGNVQFGAPSDSNK